jgi:ABC-type nitrate/sulfonate/bicarbonate transport system substrate-binding protein
MGCNRKLPGSKNCAAKLWAYRASVSVNDNMTRILLRKKNLEGAVNVRQFGGTTESAAAFLHKQIAGAVISALRVNAPMRMLLDLSELYFLYSNVVITASREFSTRNPEMLEAFVRGYLEGVAAVHEQKDRAYNVFQKYTRLKDQKLIEELYNDSSKFLDRAPRVEADELRRFSNSWAKSPSPSKPLPITPSSTAWCVKDLSTSSTRNAD